jgi:O-antigen/teichoic acid export membrane protein
MIKINTFFFDKIIKTPLLQNILYVGLGRTMVFIVPFVLLPYIYNYHGEVFIQDFTLTISSYLIANVFIDFGTTIYGSYLSSIKFKLTFLKNLFLARLLIFLILISVSYIFNDPRVFAGILLSFFNLFNFNFYFQGKLKNKVLFKQDIFGRLVFLSFFFIIVLLTNNIFISTIIALIMNNFSKLFFNRKLLFFSIKNPSINAKEFILFLKKTSSFGLSRYFIIGTTEANQLYIKNFSDSLVANYSIIEVFYKITKNLGSLFSQVLLPYFSNNKKLEKKEIYFYIILIIFFYLVAFFIVPILIIELYSYNIFESLSYAYNLFFVASIFTLINSIIGYPIHSLLNIVNKANFSIYISSLIYIIIIAISFKTLSLEIIAKSTLIMESSICLIRSTTIIYYYRKK